MESIRTHMVLLFALAVLLPDQPGRAAEHEPAASGWRQALRGLPQVAAFEVPPTRHNGEVWAFAPADDGRLWIGSDELFIFDGATREKVDLPFETYAVRALARDANGTLWVGAIDEIGHVERSEFGGWRYVSAREQLRAAGVDNLRDIWRAHRTPRGVVFVADQQILRWNGSAFDAWRLPSTPNLLSNSDGETLWIFQSGVGLLRMEDDGPRLVVRRAELPASVVFWALTPGGSDGASPESSLLIGGVEGVFLRRDGSWSRLESVSAAVANKIPLHATMIDPDTFAIGTYLGGLVIGEVDGTRLASINRASGLPHDSITGLWFDGRHHLWAGHPGGMVRIEARGAVSVFDIRNGLDDAPVLKTLAHDGETYVLSRRLLARLAPGRPGEAARVSPLANLPVPLSDAVSLDGVLWLSTYGGGVWRIAGGESSEAVPLTGYNFGLLGEHGAPGPLLLLHDTRVDALLPSAGGRWTARTISTDFGAYPVNMVRDRDGDVWVSTVTRGLFRFRLEPGAGPDAARLHLVKHFTAGDGLPQAIERPQLTTVGGRVFVFSERAILGCERDSDSFRPVPGLESLVTVAATPTDDPAEAYWVVRCAPLESASFNPPVLIRLRLRSDSQSPEWEPLDVPSLAQAGRISALQFTAAPEATVWVSGSQSLFRLALAHLSAPPELPALDLRSIRRNDTAIVLPRAGDVLPFGADTTRLHIELTGTTRAAGDTLFVQASLSGLSDEWMKPQLEPGFTFTGLRPGAYTFRARAIDPFGRTGPALTLRFTLAAPWYYRGAAIAVYVLMSLLLVFAGVRWRLRHLQRQNERLNRIVDERTRELAHSNMVKNEFLENISHEIRNPLNGIANLVDLLHDAPLPPEERRLARSLGRSTEHLKRVFSDVLGYTRLEYGHVQIEHAPFSLVQLLEDVVALFGIEAREQRVDLSLQVPDGFADGFRGDAEKIRAIVGNYVSNALKYAPGAPVQVEVRCPPPTAHGPDRVWIGVRDHGPGLSADEQAKLFQKFSRGDRAKAAGITGTGLGLATCRGLAELMDGAAGLTSEEGRGATFWIELPLERAPLPARVARDTEPAKTPTATEGAHALIVDDQEYNQAVLRGIARRLGYTAEVASHAGDVWPLIEQRTYATVFLDWELPGMNGGDIARRLRAHPHTRNAVIIATTAHDNDDIRQQCLEAQMDGFALKPFDTARIRKLLTTASARRAGQPGQVVSSFEEQPEETSATAGLSLEVFGDFAVGDPDQARHAVTLYLEALDQEMQALREAIDRGDREAVGRLAHRLRSHASLVNGVALGTAAQRLVAAARDPADADWRRHTQAVFDEAAALKRAVISPGGHSTAAG